MAKRPDQGVLDFDRVARYFRLLGVPDRKMIPQKPRSTHRSGGIRLPVTSARECERADRVLCVGEGHAFVRENKGPWKFSHLDHVDLPLAFRGT